MAVVDTWAKAMELLGLPAAASFEEAKRAYRDLVKVWHPDRFQDDERVAKLAQSKLKEINQAMDFLRENQESHRDRPRQHASKEAETRRNDAHSQQPGPNPRANAAQQGSAASTEKEKPGQDRTQSRKERPNEASARQSRPPDHTKRGPANRKRAMNGWLLGICVLILCVLGVMNLGGLSKLPESSGRQVIGARATGLPIGRSFPPAKVETSLGVEHGPAKSTESNSAHPIESRWLGLSPERVVAVGQSKWKDYYARHMGFNASDDLARAQNAQADDLFVEAYRELNKPLYNRLQRTTAVRIGKIDDQLRVIDEAQTESANNEVQANVILQSESMQAADAEFELLQNALGDRNYEPIGGARLLAHRGGPSVETLMARADQMVAELRRTTHRSTEQNDRIQQALKKLKRLVNRADDVEGSIVYGFVLGADH